MLLRFSVTNHRSIRDEQELSLVPAAIQDPEEGLIQDSAAPGGRALAAAVVYGANASGKSNLVSGLRLLCQHVLWSHRGESPLRSPFRLGGTENDPSKFVVDFLVNRVRYHYGFLVGDKAFLEEWLYAFPAGRRQTLFERKLQEFSFGRELKGRNKVISELTRPDSLYLSTAVQNGHAQLTDVGAFFASVGFVASEATRFSLPIGDPDPRTIEFLSASGAGIVSYRRKSTGTGEGERPAGPITNFLFPTPSTISPLVSGPPSPLDLASMLASFTPVDPIQLGHSAAGGIEYMDLESESAGTSRLLRLLSSTFRILDSGGLLVVDELDASLHTHASEAVLGLFCNRAANPEGAQLIATTHDTNLLRSPLLRRDQVWFTEKDDVGATHLYPLTDIRTRKGDNVEKGYLQGRFGAVPFSGAVPDFSEAV